MARKARDWSFLSAISGIPAPWTGDAFERGYGQGPPMMITRNAPTGVVSTAIGPETQPVDRGVTAQLPVQAQPVTQPAKPAVAPAAATMATQKVSPTVGVAGNPSPWLDIFNNVTSAGPLSGTYYASGPEGAVSNLYPGSKVFPHPIKGNTEILPVNRGNKFLAPTPRFPQSRQTSPVDIGGYRVNVSPWETNRLTGFGRPDIRREVWKNVTGRAKRLAGAETFARTKTLQESKQTSDEIIAGLKAEAVARAAQYGQTRSAVNQYIKAGDYTSALATLQDMMDGAAGAMGKIFDIMSSPSNKRRIDKDTQKALTESFIRYRSVFDQARKDFGQVLDQLKNFTPVSAAGAAASPASASQPENRLTVEQARDQLLATQHALSVGYVTNPTTGERKVLSDADRKLLKERESSLSRYVKTLEQSSGAGG